ncbi:MAG: 2-hydroxychromene-2-carboxylate isomerase [Leptospiraceae bacterium]|nr:2-hydroxychromene-2-carboxylate isomerase [Leptospiraceae bacterium]
MATIEFFFEFASTYSYLSVARIEALAGDSAVEIVWRPFLLGPIFKEQGWNDSPFNIYPARGRYMWRDLERRCRKYGLPFQKPSNFPRNGLRAARIATAMLADNDWNPHVPGFVRAVFDANFAKNQNIAGESVLRTVLESLSVAGSCEAILTASKSDETKLALRDATETARAAGIFGAPSLLVRTGDGANELFWGDDRLEDAITAASTPTLI